MSTRLALLGLIGIVGLALSMPVNAAPLQLHHQGRLMDATGVPLVGAHDLAVSLYDKEKNGNLLWVEELSVDFDNGYFAIVLGEDGNNPLEDDNFLGDVFVEVAVNGMLLDDRHPVVSVPFAIYSRNSAQAETATNVSGGLVDASEIMIDGTTIIDQDGNFYGTDTLLSLLCDSGDTPVYDGVDWTCAEYDPIVNWLDIDDRPQGLNDGDDDTLGEMNGLCAQGQFPAWDEANEEWFCGDVKDPGALEILEVVTEDPIDLAAGSTIDGEDISTMSLLDVDQHLTINSVDLANGSTVNGEEISTLNMTDITDYMASHIVELETSSHIDGVPISTLTTDDVRDYLGKNNGVDLHSKTTIDGIDISTLTLDQVKDYLAVDNGVDLNINTTVGGVLVSSLTVNDVDAHLEANQVLLGAGSQLDGSDIVSQAVLANGVGLGVGSTVGGEFITTIPAVDTHLNDKAINLNASTTLNNATIINEPRLVDYLDQNAVDLAAGTTLEDEAVATYPGIDSYVGTKSFDLGTGSTVNGNTIATTDVTDSTYVDAAGDTMTGALRLAYTNAALELDGQGDGNVEWSLQSTGEKLEFFETDDGDKIHFRIKGNGEIE
ncbi:MAG: hypothetical protein HN348_29650, partial [Proteobacteria bacterium]|nr:hypothetical protein [Pseudomonadota bacterium]